MNHLLDYTIDESVKVQKSWVEEGGVESRGTSRSYQFASTVPVHGIEEWRQITILKLASIVVSSLVFEIFTLD